MPTLKLQWWLWNQMFQYALGFALAREKNENIHIDGSFLENRFFLASWTFRHYELWVFHIPQTYSSLGVFFRRYMHPYIWAFFQKLRYRERYIKENAWVFIKEFPRESYLDGWFQSYRYFERYSEEIKNIFTVQTLISSKNQQSLDHIIQVWDRAVSIHIRRGDYVSLAGANKWHWVCSLGYYESAIMQMIEKLHVPVFFIFSDDIEWCKKNIIFQEGIVAHYIDHNGSAGHEDLRLMYSCSHHIIANSSFSWWWAYLGRNPQKVIIAPKKWLQTDSFQMKNLIPQSWILL